MATARFRLLSVALYTSPIPPTPIWAVTSYGPRRVPAVSAIGVGPDYRRNGGADLTGRASSRGVLALICVPHRISRAFGDPRV